MEQPGELARTKSRADAGRHIMPGHLSEKRIKKAGEQKGKRMAVRLGKQQYLEGPNHFPEGAQILLLKMVEDQASNNNAAGHLGKGLK